MKKLNAEDLRNLKWGDYVVRVQDGTTHGLQLVGLMPNSENTLIFSDGDYLTTLWIDPEKNIFEGQWFSGEYDSKLIGSILVQELEEEIERIKRLYIKEL